MTKYYLQVLDKDLSICIDSDVNYYHEFAVGDILTIEMWSDRGPKIKFGKVEYDAVFTWKWNTLSSKRLTIAVAISSGILVDVTVSVVRESKLKSLGI
jgi:hypothetical protein